MSGSGANQASGPIAYWRLDDTTTTIMDSTANARNGTATAGVQLNQPGLVPSEPSNSAIRVAGADRVLVPGFEKIGTGGYTVEYWVKPNALPTGCCQNLVGDGEAAVGEERRDEALGRLAEIARRRNAAREIARADKQRIKRALLRRHFVIQRAFAHAARGGDDL